MLYEQKQEKAKPQTNECLVSFLNSYATDKFSAAPNVYENGKKTEK